MHVLIYLAMKKITLTVSGLGAKIFFSFLILIALGFSANKIYAQGVLATYTFGGAQTCTPATAYTLPTVTAAVSTWLSFSDYTRGAGLTCVATAGVFQSSGWSTSMANSVTNNDYHQFGLTSVSAGRVVTLTSISITHYRSAQTNISYELRSSLDGYVTPLIPTVPPSTSTTNGPAGTTHTFNLSSLFANRLTASGVVTFRLYTFASAAGTTWTNDNITINGIVTPTSIAGTAQSICFGTPSVTLAANAVSGINSYPNPPGGVGTWVQQSGPATVTFGSASSPTSTASGFTVIGTYVLRWAVTHAGSGNHLSQSTVSILVNNPTAVVPLTIYALDLFGNPFPSDTICQFQQLEFFVNAPFVNILPNTFTWKVNGVP